MFRFCAPIIEFDIDCQQEGSPELLSNDVGFNETEMCTSRRIDNTATISAVVIVFHLLRSRRGVNISALYIELVMILTTLKTLQGRSSERAQA